MTGTVATQVKAIAFDRDIERLTEGFTGREWVFEEIDRWLQQGNERFFILTGEPGVGKSAIAAKLTQIRQDIAAYHFCIAGRSGTIEPNGVLLSLAAQLIDYFPDYAEALAKTIKPLKLSINVEINIETLKDSEVRGVVISNLHTQNPQEALNIVLRQALAELPKPPQESKIILIDSLDEAVTFNARDNLATLLSGLNDLPSWVRLILTSRPEDRVLVEFKPLEPHRLEETSEEGLADIRQYVEERMEQPVLQEQLSEADVVPLGLVDQVVQLSSGNFLYTKLLLDEIEAKRQALNDLSALPKNIDDIYLAFLRRFKHEEWKSQYQPILGTLTAALEPVTEDELENFTNIKPRQLRQDLGVIRQFLDEARNEAGKTTYAIFHQSLRNYLLNKDRNHHFWCDVKEQHALIIDYYKKKTQMWQHLSQIDRYGVRHLAQHLVIAERVKELHTLLATETSSRQNMWFVLKDQIGDTAGFLADIALAWKQVEEEFERTHQGRLIGLQCRYALITSTFNSIATNIPVCTLVSLIEQNIWTAHTGLAYIRRMLDYWQQFEAINKLIPCLPEFLKQEGRVLQEQFVQQAFKALSLENPSYDQAEKLIKLIPYLTQSLLLETFKIIDFAVEQMRNNDDGWIGTPFHYSVTGIYPEDEYNDTFCQKVEELKQKHLNCKTQLDNPNQETPLTKVEERVAELLEASEDKLKSEIKEVHLGNEIRREQILASVIINDKNEQEYTLIKLFPYLPSSLKKHFKQKILEILTNVLEIQDIHERWKRIKKVLPDLEQSLQKELISQALSDIKAISREKKSGRKRFKADELTELAIKLPNPLRNQILKEALSIAFKIRRLDKRHDRIMKLFPHLPDSLKKQVFSELLNFELIERADSLLELLPHLPKELRRQAIETFADPSLLDAYTSRWSNGLVSYTTRYIKYSLDSCRENILSFSINTKDESLQLIMFLALLPYLSKSSKDQAIQIIENINQNTWKKVIEENLKYLAYTFPSLPDNLKEKTIDTILLTESDRDEIYLCKMFSNLPDALKEELIARLGYIPLSFFVHLPKSLDLKTIQQLINYLQKYKVKTHWLYKTTSQQELELLMMGLVSLLPHLPEPFLEQWLSIASNIEDTQTRILTLKEFLSSSTINLSTRYSLWIKILHAASSRTRSDLFSNIQALIPAVISLGGHEAVSELTQAIQDVGCWWK
jgi:hypothetical protein